MAWATLEAAVPAAVQQGAEAEAWLAVEELCVAPRGTRGSPTTTETRARTMASECRGAAVHAHGHGQGHHHGHLYTHGYYHVHNHAHDHNWIGLDISVIPLMSFVSF